MTAAGPARRFALGCTAAQRATLEAALGGSFEVGVPDEPRADDLIVLASQPGGEGPALPLGNAFSACRALKVQPRAAVYLVLEAADGFGAEIARFCLADGVLRAAEGADGALDGLDELTQRWQRPRDRASVDDLLARLEREIAGDEGRQASALQRMLDAENETGFVARLTDGETGLFDGPFASFKLDEEFKRARRFHQPLSLLLLDCGVAEWPADPTERATVLAEVASIFLVECRDIDVLARFTETVFLFLLPGTGTAGAEALIRRVAGALRERRFSGGLQVDPAAGIVTAPMAGIPDRRTFLARAEACLRVALEAEGEGRICVDHR